MLSKHPTIWPAWHEIEQIKIHIYKFLYGILLITDITSNLQNYRTYQISVIQKASPTLQSNSSKLLPLNSNEHLKFALLSPIRIIKQIMNDRQLTKGA